MAELRAIMCRICGEPVGDGERYDVDHEDQPRRFCSNCANLPDVERLRIERRRERAAAEAGDAATEQEQTLAERLAERGHGASACPSCGSAAIQIRRTYGLDERTLREIEEGDWTAHGEVYHLDDEGEDEDGHINLSPPYDENNYVTLVAERDDLVCADCGLDRGDQINSWDAEQY